MRSRVCSSRKTWIRRSSPTIQTSPATASSWNGPRSEEHTSELQSPDHLHFFPYTTLFRSGRLVAPERSDGSDRAALGPRDRDPSGRQERAQDHASCARASAAAGRHGSGALHQRSKRLRRRPLHGMGRDRKSTRLNSSHQIISTFSPTRRSSDLDAWWRPSVPTGLTEPRWVRAIEIRPVGKNARKITHHALARLQQPEDMDPALFTNDPNVSGDGLFMEWAEIGRAHV